MALSCQFPVELSSTRMIYQDAQAVCWWVREAFPAAEDLTLDRQIMTCKDERTTRLTICLLFEVLQGYKHILL